MERLTADEFIDKLNAGNAWSLERNYMLNEIELTVRDTAGVVTSYLGPDPIAANYAEYRAFIGRINDRIEPNTEGVQQTKEQFIKKLIAAFKDMRAT